MLGLFKTDAAGTLKEIICVGSREKLEEKKRTLEVLAELANGFNRTQEAKVQKLKKEYNQVQDKYWGGEDFDMWEMTLQNFMKQVTPFLQRDTNSQFTHLKIDEVTDLG